MNPTQFNQMNMGGLDRGALDSYSLKFGYPLDTHRLWERAAFGYLSDDGRLANALHRIIDGGDDEGDDECDDECGCDEYGGINSCIDFYVGIQ